MNTIWVNCDECVSIQSLFDRILSQLADSVGGVYEGGCDALNTFVAHLQVLLKNIDEHMVLVLDRIDQIMEPLPRTAFSVLLKLNELVIISDPSD